MQSLEILAFALLAGIVGSILGLGGGLVMTPALTLLLGIDIRYAIGASLISVIATSSGSAVAYLRDRITNVRVGMFLEVGTTLGAILGATLGGIIPGRALLMLFGGFLLYSCYLMVRNSRHDKNAPSNPHPWATKLRMHGQFFDKAQGKTVEYQVEKVTEPFGVMIGAGVLSGLLGIGGGAFKVMAMDVFMRLPLKVSSATSNFMMGATATASAGIYLMRGNIDPLIAGPVALGVLGGSTIGARIMPHLKNKTLRLMFIPVLIYVSVMMIRKGVAG